MFFGTRAACFLAEGTFYLRFLLYPISRGKAFAAVFLILRPRNPPKMYPNILSLVCLKCTLNFCSKNLLEKHLRSTGHFVPSERKLLDSYKPIARATRHTQERDPSRQSQNPNSTITAIPFIDSPNQTDIEVEEGEITPEKQEEYLGWRQRGEIEIRNEKEREGGEEKAREWNSMNNIKGVIVGKKEGRVVGSNAGRYSNGMRFQVIRLTRRVNDCRCSFLEALDFKLTLALPSQAARLYGEVILDCQVSETEKLRSRSVGYCSTSLRTDDGYRNRARASQENNVDHAGGTSVHREHKHLLVDRERSWSPQHSQTSYQRSRGTLRIQKNKLLTKPKLYGPEIFQQPKTKNAYQPEPQAGRVDDRSVGGEQVNRPICKPLKLPNEPLDDRDDVGEWRAEIHGTQYYYFD